MDRVEHAGVTQCTCAPWPVWIDERWLTQPIVVLVGREQAVAARCAGCGRWASADPPSQGALLQARQELRELSGQDEGRRIDDILGSVGLAGVADQLKDLRLGEGPGVWVWVWVWGSRALWGLLEWQTS